MPEVVDEVNRVVYVDGIHLARDVVVLIACSDEFVLSRHLARAETSRAWRALLSSRLRVLLRDHRGMGLVRRIKAACWWCCMHTEAPLPAAEIMRSMPADADIDLLCEQYAIRPKETDAPAWGERPVWQEFHNQTPYPYSVD